MSGLIMPYSRKCYWSSVLCLLVLNYAPNYVLSSSSTPEYDEDFNRATLSDTLIKEEEEASQVSLSLTAQDHQGNSTLSNNSKENEGIKKVDKLGKALKRKVEMLQMHDGRKVGT